MSVPRIQLLSPEERERIHGAAIRILDRVGVRYDHERTLTLLADAGARVDLASRVAKLPEQLVMDCVRRAGQAYTLYGRNPKNRASFGQGKLNFMSSNTQVVWTDVVTRERRHCTFADATRATRLGDALSEIDIVGSMASPHELDFRTRCLHLLAMMLQNTSKPISLWPHDAATSRYAIAMCTVVAGGEVNLRQRPMLELLVDPISPLQYRGESMEVLSAFAAIGHPVGIAPQALSMATSPATLSGTLAQVSAEILAGNTVAQLLQPGLPICFGGIPSILDAATTLISYGAPEQGLMAVGATEMARFYGLPCYTNTGLADGKLPDVQAGLEKGMTVLMATLAGCDMFGHLGIAGSDQGASLAQLVIDNEMARYVKRVADGFAVDAETLAEEVIARAGIGGNFLADEHTVRHFRTEHWRPGKLWDRNDWDNWMARGGKTMLNLALERQEDLLATHEPEPLPASQVEELERIVAEADRELLGARR